MIKGKICIQCRESYPCTTQYFAIRRRIGAGVKLRPECRKCTNANVSKRRAADPNWREKHNAYQKKWAKENPAKLKLRRIQSSKRRKIKG